MIKLSRLNNSKYYLNSDIIEIIEETPDTVITTLNGKKFVVLETVEEVIDRIVEFRGRIFKDAK
jgi:flagellar protein FlbD